MKKRFLLLPTFHPLLFSCSSIVAAYIHFWHQEEKHGTKKKKKYLGSWNIRRRKTAFFVTDVVEWAHDSGWAFGMSKTKRAEKNQEKCENKAISWIKWLWLEGNCACYVYGLMWRLSYFLIILPHVSFNVKWIYTLSRRCCSSDCWRC